MSTFPSLELVYFDIPGKAEAIRLACIYAGIPFKDTRLTRDEFLAMKTSGELPYGQVPLLIVDGKFKIAQSAAIIRYIGKISCLYPSDPVEAAMVDSLIDQEIDMFSGLSVSRYRERFGFECLSDETVATVRKALNDEVLPRHLLFFEKMLTNSTTGWVANTSGPTIADFVLVPRMQWLESGANDGISSDILASYPAIKAMMSSLLSSPRIEEYYRQR